MPEDTENMRAHIRVRGRVQNVGFRAHVQYSARQIGVTGWVRNVGYDVVETLAEGSREDLERFISMVKTGPRGSQVDESTVEWETPTGEFSDFQVRRSM